MEREKQKKRLVEFDRLTKEKQDEKTSHWRGSKGLYVFENTGELEPRKPIRRVYKDRAYMTGLFRSRKPEEFLGDLKGPEGKQYLLFRLLDRDNIVIFLRSAS